LTHLKTRLAALRTLGHVRSLPGALLVASFALTGCASTLLPESGVNADAGFRSFEEAQTAFARIVPRRTTMAELSGLGFDIAANNVRQIAYPDLVARLAPNGISLEHLDNGIRECILARMECRLYEYRIGRESRVREGSVILDLLNFRRVTAVDSWRFDALVALRDDVVLFNTFGGEPKNKRVEREVNPLGPLQGAGESAAGQLILR